ncbi:MAG: amidohydrolase [Bradyrhizobiaceae bacterium]|nr:amidohydrolase [Bradyrhizobiaceae bacterium]
MTHTGCEIHIERGRIRAILPHSNSVVVRTETRTYEFPNAWVSAGFVDAHVHLLGLGKRLSLISLHEASSEIDCIRILQDAALPQNGWLQAMGWNQERWALAEMPSLATLSMAFPETPVICSRIDGHALWVNAEALSRAGMKHPTGILVDQEMDQMVRAVPKPTKQELTQQLIAASNAFARAGVTEVHDMDVHPDIVALTRELAESARLAVRVQSFVSAQDDEWQHQGLLPAGGELQRTAGVKMYADGALGSRGAAFFDQYADDQTNGSLFLTEDELVRKCLDAVNAGWWCIAVHAIGDAAVHRVLNAFERVRQDPAGSEVILRLEHAQHVREADLPRFADLQVVASVQPSQAHSDAGMVVHRIGTKRMTDAYRWQSFINAGARICTGTDAPIEHESALHTIYAATHRPGDEQGGWKHDEVLHCDQALLAATQWAHEAAGMDYRRGSLQVGMDADLVVLDRDPCEHSSSTPQAKVLATFTAGVCHTSNS